MKKTLLYFLFLFCFGSSRAQLHADFTWCPVYDTINQICCIQFTDLSTNPGGSISAYFYQFGDGDQSTNPNPRHCYLVIGTYAIYYIVYDSMGNTDTAYGSIQITHLDSTGCNCDSLGITEPETGRAILLVHPSPVRNEAQVELPEKSRAGDYHFEIFNSEGVLLRKETLTVPPARFTSAGLPAGLYHFRLTDPDGRPVGSGKFLVE